MIFFAFIFSCSTEELSHTDEVLDDYPTRKIRLLSPREYEVSARKLFLDEDITSCSTLADCDEYGQSCISGNCINDPCSIRSFVYYGHPNDEVYFYSEAFDWAPHNAWKFQWNEILGAWYVKGEIPMMNPREQRYLFEVNGNWEVDPFATEEVEMNGLTFSVLDTKCSKEGFFKKSYAEHFPIHAKGTDFYFDHESNHGVVTPSHLFQITKSSKRIAQNSTFNLSILCESNQECYTQEIEHTLLQAFRRVPTSIEIESYRETLNHSTEEFIQRVLLSPEFLYRNEMGKENSNELVQLNQFEIATLLSFFAQGVGPDKILLEKAKEGLLLDANVRIEEFNRLLQNHTARRHWQEFLLQWLGIKGIRFLEKDLQYFPNFNPLLAVSMEQEIRSISDDVFFHADAKLSDLFLRETSYVNMYLADLYGMDHDHQATATLQILPRERRSGIISSAAWLTMYSNAEQSNPIKRGHSVRERLLCFPLPEAPAISSASPTRNDFSTNQNRYKEHTSNPKCQSCHQYIDGIGFGLEQFDGIGLYHESENELPISTSGEIVAANGVNSETISFDSPEKLSEELILHSSLASCFVKQLYQFLHGEMVPLNHSFIQEHASDWTDQNIRTIQHSLIRHPSFVFRSTP